MSAALSLPIQGPWLRTLERIEAPAPTLPVGCAQLAALLPDGGFPLGVTELRAPRRLGGGTRLALHALAALHAQDAEAHAAWIDPESSLYAPGLAAAGVDLARLLVVRPPWEQLLETCVKVAASSAFPLVVVDADPIGPFSGRRPLAARGELLVRKLQLAAEAMQGSVLLLTDAHAGRAPLPVTLRLSLERRPNGLSARIDKERHGRVGGHAVLPYEPSQEAS